MEVDLGWGRLAFGLAYAPDEGGHTMQPLINDEVALITGASRGIGRAIALGLGEAGWTVDLTSRTAQDGDDAFASALGARARAFAVAPESTWAARASTVAAPLWKIPA